MGKGSYSWKMLIGSILAGFIYAFGGEMFWRRLGDFMPGTALAIIYFIGLFLFVSLVIWLTGRFIKAYSSKDAPLKQWVKLAAAMVVLTVFFELIYEIRWEKEAVEIPYVFLIDNSGSMDGSDPYGKRYDAIKELLADKSPMFEYAVYTFADTTTLVREMGSIKQVRKNMWG